MYVLRLGQIIDVINGALKERLKAIGIKDVDGVANALVQKIIKDQSLLTMMSV